MHAPVEVETHSRRPGRAPDAARDVPSTVVWQYAAEHAVDALEARLAFVEAFRGTSLPCDDIGAEIVFSELVSNVVKHAPGPIVISFEASADRAYLRVYDRGPGFRLHPAIPLDLYAESGRGLFLAREFCSELHVAPSSILGKCVSAVFARAGSVTTFT